MISAVVLQRQSKTLQQRLVETCAEAGHSPLRRNHNKYTELEENSRYLQFPSIAVVFVSAKLTERS